MYSFYIIRTLIILLSQVYYIIIIKLLKKSKQSIPAISAFMATIQQLWLQNPHSSSKQQISLYRFKMFYQILHKLSLANIFGLLWIEIYFILVKTKLINHITSVFIVQTKLSFQEYVQGIQHLLIRTSYRGNNSRNAFFATTHLLYKTFFQSFQTHAFPARNSSRQCLISLQCLMYMYFYSFCKNAIITTKFKVLFVYIFYSNLIFINFYVRRMRR